MTSTSKTTELEAINTLLLTIGDTAVTQDDVDAASDTNVLLAVATLNEMSKAVQSKGWRFNTIDRKTLSPDELGYISVSASVVFVQPIESSAGQYALSIRGDKLYDLTEGTDTFDADVVVSMREILAWADLPEEARRYITISAARVFAARSTASQVLVQFTERDEYMALANLQQTQAAAAGYTVANTPGLINATLYRQRGRRI